MASSEPTASRTSGTLSRRPTSRESRASCSTVKRPASGSSWRGGLRRQLLAASWSPVWRHGAAVRPLAGPLFPPTAEAELEHEIAAAVCRAAGAAIQVLGVV